jgi:serine/threonine protein kinase
VATRTPRKPTPTGRLSTRTHERRIGELVDGRYTLTAVLGVGRQGAVFRARDQSTGGDVALKILHVMAPEAPICERLEREADALERLGAEGVVRVLGRAWDRGKVFCMITEVLEGETLESRLVRLEKAKQTIEHTELLRIISAVAATLDRAHTLGMVHRDVKPSNIFLTTAGSVKLLDFGYVKIIGAGTYTAIDVVPGSPAYVAPEVTHVGELDGRADIYGLGVVIYRCLTRQLPFDGNHPIAILDHALNADRPSLFARRPDLAPEIDAFSERALAADPRDRFETATALARALDYTLRLDPEGP